MTDWSAFAGIAGVVLTALLALARLSRATASTTREPDASTDTGRGVTEVETPGAGGGPDHETQTSWERTLADDAATPRLGPVALLANVAVSQGALGTVLVFGAWWAAVPASALGLGATALAPAVLVAGVAAGGLLYLANEAAAAAGRRYGVEGAEAFRAALAPESRRGWAVLLLVVLPVVAAFEELLFRGVLVGALAVGFGVSPWVLAGLSSVAFAAGHGAQGRLGVAVTGVLGFALAAVFVLTESLAAVVVAHYLVNALEFVVNER